MFIATLWFEASANRHGSPNLIPRDDDGPLTNANDTSTTEVDTPLDTGIQAAIDTFVNSTVPNGTAPDSSLPGFSAVCMVSNTTSSE